MTVARLGALQFYVVHYCTTRFPSLTSSFFSFELVPAPHSTFLPELVLSRSLLLSSTTDCYLNW